MWCFQRRPPRRRCPLATAAAAPKHGTAGLPATAATSTGSRPKAAVRAFQRSPAQCGTCSPRAQSGAVRTCSWRQRMLETVSERVSAWWISIEAPPGYANTVSTPSRSSACFFWMVFCIDWMVVRGGVRSAGVDGNGRAPFLLQLRLSPLLQVERAPASALPAAARRCSAAPPAAADARLPPRRAAPAAAPRCACRRAALRPLPLPLPPPPVPCLCRLLSLPVPVPIYQRTHLHEDVAALARLAVEAVDPAGGACGAC